VNTLVRRYEVTETLGGGGFAITYLARDIMQPSKPLCVVKQLRPNQTHPRVIDFFNKEAAILEKLGKHPQIPQLLAHFQEDDNLYIVQEYIQGHDLSQEISPGKRLSEAYVSKLLRDVLEVLSFVHKYGVIHRDIKPQNLMRRREDGKIFLIDFGAVKELGTLMVNTKGEIASSVVIGTAGYMPNEQANGKPCLASDVYAVGMIAISALTGLQPFELEEDPQTGEVIWLDRAQVSQHLAEMITKMVRRHHSLRYVSAKDALQGLTTVAQPISIAPTELNPPTPYNKYFTEDLGNGVILEMTEIPGGEFLMGSPTSEGGRENNESPQHRVTIKPFFMGKFAVTQAQYQAIMGKNPSNFKGEKRPVEQVNWNEATKFCQKLTQKTGRTYRLPSEAEWEYACRAGTTTPFHFGETITTDLANYRGIDVLEKGRLYPGNYGNGPKGEFREQTTDVGSFFANAFGLYDMHGNVWEWCQDTWHDNYNNAPNDGNAWISFNLFGCRVIRGGSYFTIPEACRSAKCFKGNPVIHNIDVGFRVVCGVAPRTLN